MRSIQRAGWLGVLLLGTMPLSSLAQPATEDNRPSRPEQSAIVSPERLPDGRIIFRILAPKAGHITVTGDLNEGLPPPIDAPSSEEFAPPPPAVILTKQADGIWSGTTSAPLQPGAYRYVFEVDGIVVVDQSNKRTSPSQGKVSSLLLVPGDFSEQRAVPHGALSEINYEPKSYGSPTQRQLWVYTPPGYETSTQRYPVMYLIHGGGDSAESWTTVGRANMILDNLLAERKAVPFIVVMISGWTPRGPQSETIDAANDPLNAELVSDIVPMIEKRYRVLGSRTKRALSGLSMGGYQTLTLGMKNIDLFDYVMPMSTGWFTDDDRAAYIATNRSAIESADRRLKLFRWGWGTTDIARENGLASMAMLRKAGMNRIETIEVPGAHSWTTWRQLFRDFAQRVFK